MGHTLSIYKFTKNADYNTVLSNKAKNGQI